MASGDAEAVREFFTAALYASVGWPESFPRRARAAWDQAESQLVVDWELPEFSVVSAISRYRYIKSDDRETQIPRPAGERKALYRQLLAQSALAVIAEMFRADRGRLVSSVTVNGFVGSPDPVTGRRSKVFLLTVMAGRQAFSRLDLANVDPVSCLEGLRAQLSPRPENLVAVHPVRLAVAAGAEPSDEASAASGDLMDMDPVEFEDLVAALFQAMGMKVMTTARSGDGGVDVQAMDPDPIGRRPLRRVKYTGRYSGVLAHLPAESGAAAGWAG
jgi:restriction system protein